MSKDNYEIVCKCGDHITLSKTGMSTYMGTCLGCGIHYTLTLTFSVDEDRI